MPEESFLTGTAVIWRDEQIAAERVFFQPAYGSDGRSRAIGTCAGIDRYARFARMEHAVDDGFPFL